MLTISLRSLLIFVATAFSLMVLFDYCSRQSVDVVLFYKLSGSSRNNRIDEIQELAALRSRLEEFLLENGFELMGTFLQNQDINDPSKPPDNFQWGVDVRDYVFPINNQQAYHLRSKSLFDFSAIELKFQDSNNPFWCSDEMLRERHSEIRNKIDQFWNLEIKEVSIDFMSQ